MGTLLIAIGAFFGFLIAYHTYGRWLARKIFKLDPEAIVPSVALNDDKDFVPTRKAIVFGHHFTSIAGTGPIVGPAIAVMWGWLPALLWVFFGSIFIGAVHDFGALVVSLRNRGQTVGDIAGRVLNARVRLMFLFVLFMALTIVLAIFGLVIAAVFRQYPAAIFPCLVQIPIAVTIGMLLHRRGMNILLPSIIALAVMYLTVVFGDVGMLGAFNTMLAGWSNITWVAVLLGYSYVASVLPVWTLLQPRDYINSLQLISALGLIVVGLIVAGTLGGAIPVEGMERQPLELVAPMIRWRPEGAPLLIPFLFITIACGAISGFHCLVSSGTSSKQLKCETDAHFIGYGSMLTEGFLATLVILACVAGLGLGAKVKFPVAADGTTMPAQLSTPELGEFTLVPGAGETFLFTPSGQQPQTITAGRGEEVIMPGLLLASASRNEAYLLGKAAYNQQYKSWGMASGLSVKIGAFVEGSANFLKSLGISSAIAVALMGVLVASFAGTTLDTACRLQRYVVQEIAATFVGRRGGAEASSATFSFNPFVILTNKHGATIFAVGLATALAALPAPGKPWNMETAGGGGMILWPLFGATNQLLGGLAFMVIAFYLWRRKAPVWFLILPMLFMLVMPAAAMAINLPEWLRADEPNWPIIVIGVLTVVLEAWMIVEAIILWPKVRGELETQLPPLSVTPSRTL